MRYLHIPLMVLMTQVSYADAEILLQDDFSGDLSENWVVFGDPLPYIDSISGSPPPSFCNNGDSMYGSGVVSREVFAVEGGLVLEADIYIDCEERGTWVTAALSFVLPWHLSEDTNRSGGIITTAFAYYGELNWGRPHLGGFIMVIMEDSMGGRFHQEFPHLDHLLAGWQRFAVRIAPDRTVSWTVNDSLISVSSEPLPLRFDSLRVLLGDRSSSWGIALHDNVILRRP